MSNSIYWLSQNSGISMKVISPHCAEFDYKEKKLIVFCPNSDEYEITEEIVQNARKEKADIIAYPYQWCRATREAKEFGKSIGISVIPFGEFIPKYKES